MLPVVSDMRLSSLPGVLLLVVTLSACGPAVAPLPELEILQNPQVTWLAPIPTDAHILSVSLLPAGTGFGVGQLGTIIKTTDGAKSWSLAARVGQNGLKGVAFGAPQRAIAVGDRGTVARTDNGGETWTAVPSGVAADLRSVAFASPDVVVAVGANGTILRSGDGGRTWQPRVSGVSTTLRSVAWPAPSIAVAVGDDGVVLRSPDEALTWTAVPTGTSAAIRAVTFLDGNTGVAVGGDDRLWQSSRVVLRTGDSGATWSPVGAPSGLRLYGVTAISTTAVVAVGEKGASLRSTDAGRTWQPVEVDKTAWLATVSASGQTLVATGESGKIFRSENGGTKWSNLQKAPPLPAYITAVARPSADVVVVAGNTTIMRSVRGGPFERAKSVNKKYINALAFADPLVGVAAGQDGSMQRTTDGGATWVEVASGTKRFVQGVVFTDARTGIAIGSGWGEGPLLVGTADAGRTWQPVPTVAAREPCGGDRTTGGLALRPSGVGMVLCQGGAVYKTSDHGRTWVETGQSLAASLASIAMLDDRTAVAVGSRGVIFRTDDGGASWARCQSGTYGWLSRVSFADQRRGLIVGWNGLLLSTQDGGKTWQRDPLLTVRGLNALAVDEAGAVIAGNNGLLLWRAWPPNQPAQTLNEEGVRR